MVALDDFVIADVQSSRLHETALLLLFSFLMLLCRI